MMNRPLKCIFLFSLFFLSCCGESIQVERLSLRVTYVQDAEKLSKGTFAVENDEWNSFEPTSDLAVSPSDTLVAQASCIDKSGDPVQPTQASLRIVDESTVPPTDTIWPLTQRRQEMRREVSLKHETKVDHEFWRSGVPYSVQLIVGDPRLERGVVWTVTTGFIFNSSIPSKVPRGVFDFDLAVRKNSLPEFHSTVPENRKQVPLTVVITFTILSMVPIVGLLAMWSKLGALSSKPHSSVSSRLNILLFEICLIAHAAALGMFWVQWNIVTTWKVMAVIMVPTLYFGHRALGFVASRDNSAAHNNHKKQL